MTVEELDIVVQANVEQAVKEFQKLIPTVKQIVQQITENINKTDLKSISGKVNQAVQQVKQRIKNLKESTKSNSIELKVVTEDAKKQISQIGKEINSLQEKINARQIKLDITNNTLDKIRANTNQEVIKEMPDAGNKKITQETYNRLDNNIDYMSLIKESDKLNSEIIRYNQLLDSAKLKMSELSKETSQTGTSQNKLTSFFSSFKSKLDQAKGSVGNFKSTFNQIPKITQNITNNIKNISKGIKNGLSHVLKYAGALFSLRGIYSVLSSSAQSWLSSQNAGAQQLSANIEYMKNAIGSVLAPVIEFVTNLVYQLMKAIQSVAYALTGVNIFAKATASSMKSTANSAKQASKSLAGVHNEINNVSENDNGGGGSIGSNIDLSQMENTPSSILDAIKSGNWEEVGSLIGEKINNALASIPWNKIQQTAKNIGQNIAKFLNGFIGSTDWRQIGNTLAQGLNTAIYFVYEFVSTLNWKQLGTAISDGINGLFSNIDWKTAGQALSDGIKGVLNTIGTAIREIDWSSIGQDIGQFLTTIDWDNIFTELQDVIADAIIALIQTVWGLLGECISKADLSWEGLWNGIATTTDVQLGITDNILKEGLNKILESMGYSQEDIIYAWNHPWEVIGITFTEMWNGLSQWIGDLWQGICETATQLFSSLGEFLSSLWQNICNIATEIWNNISKFFSETWNWISEQAQSVWNFIASFFTDTWQGIMNTITEVWNAICDFLEGIWDWIVQTITNTFNNIKDFIQNTLNTISTIWSNIWNGISSVITNIWNGIINTISGIINGIRNTISNVLNSISSIWNNVWNGIANVVTNIWNGIWNSIRWVINSILSGIESFVNGVIRGVNFVLGGISNVANAVGSLLGLSPINLRLGYISLPRLEKGGVLFEETAFIGGEYSGARNNPEIVTPENEMYDTMKRAILDSDIGNGSDRPLNIMINVGNKKLGQILLEDLRDRKRHTGKDIEALVGG